MKVIDGNKFYSISELCKKVGMSHSTIMRWINKGIVKVGKMPANGTIIISELEVTRLIGEILEGNTTKENAQLE